MKDLLNDIRDWHLETFPGVTFEVIGRKLVEEAGELLRAIEGSSDAGSSQCAEEAADVFIVLAALCSRAGIDVAKEARQKMKINRRRRYFDDGTGWFVRRD